MKLLVIGNEERVEKFLPRLAIVDQVEYVTVPIDATNEQILEVGADADFVLVDAIATFGQDLIEKMPNLKLINSEGVAYNGIDCGAAAERGIYVCNNRGVNAVGVAEQTVLLILALIKQLRRGDTAVRAGKQIELKEQLMVEGIYELGGMTVGLVGFGAIAREVAKRLVAFDVRVVYNKRSPLSPEVEDKLHAWHLPLDDLLEQSDVVSLHVPVTDATRGMVSAEFLGKMRKGSYLVNTARGELVDNDAVVAAIKSGQLAGAGFDTIAPEPVKLDNPLLNLPDELQDRVIFSPHIGGVTANMFPRAYKMVWENIARVAAGDRPLNIVNGL
ncbi:MAG: 2-hydroxyacid dehydrogenase [Coriobacteriales bacterium]|jgi:phosphoglycerate dehydrogenase-like enzyme